jgi:hypothetical protein
VKPGTVCQKQYLLDLKATLSFICEYLCKIPVNPSVYHIRRINIFEMYGLRLIFPIHQGFEQKQTPCPKGGAVSATAICAVFVCTDEFPHGRPVNKCKMLLMSALIP